jgi:hypothetical protein
MNSCDSVRVRRCAGVALLLLFSALSAFSQRGQGRISGLVTDPSGALVAGAQVVLLNKDTGLTQHTVSSAAGLYTFISVNPGEYQVQASQKGFSSVVQEHVTVSVDQTTELNITMRVGSDAETVTVTGTSNLVDPGNSTVGSLITAPTIERVPMLYRNVYDLVQLSAGVTPPNGSPNSSDSTQSISNISYGRPQVDVSAATINGAIVGSVYYMLDGSPLGVAENNTAAIIPAMGIPEDSVDEVRVETQNTPASYQSGAAGVISLVSKSGTNSFHGDAFGVFRPNVLSANEYFNKQSELSAGMSNTPPTFHRYQEGGAIGGPIKKDKLFFFGDYEDTQQSQFEGIDHFTVPTSAERTGDFSAMNFKVYNPTLPDNAGGTRQQFAGNIIPNPNPISVLFLSKMPACNLPSAATCNAATTDVVNNFGAPGYDPLQSHKFDVRVDWAQSEKQRLFSRFSFENLFNATANVFPSGWDINYAQIEIHARNIVVGDDLNLNPTTVLNLRYSFTRDFQNEGGPPSYSSVNITQLGFPASLASQVDFKQLPFMVFGDVGGGVGGSALYNVFICASENSDTNATMTKVFGKHDISFGFEWMKRYLNVGQPPAPVGAYEFDISATDQSVASSVGGSDFASMLIGMAADPGGPNPESNFYPNFTKSVFAAESSDYYGSFIEDTFHPSPTLTLTGGLRWEIFGGRDERFNRQEYFDPTAANTVNGVSYTGAEVYVNGSHRSPFAAKLADFGPRLGVAWQPIPRLVVRSGAGIYYGPSTHDVGSANYNTDGFSSSTTWNGTCYNSDGNTVFNGTSCGANTGSPLNVFTGPYSLSNAFPNGVNPILTTVPSGLGNNLGLTLNTVLRSQRIPTIYNFNLAVEYELPHQVVVTVGYVGSRGLFLPFSSVDLNQLDLGTIAKYQSALTTTTVPNQWAPILPATNANYGSPTVPLFVSVQPYPQFGNGLYGTGNGIIAHGYAAGDSEYSSLQTKVQKRLTKHFTTLSTFTWGKIMTDDGNPPLGFVGSHNGTVQDWRNLSYEHSISPQDVKYQFAGQVSYDLPGGNGQGFISYIRGGWTVNSILYLSTGVPINSPLSGTSPSFFNQRSDMVCNPRNGAPHTPSAWFNNSCFVQPGTETGGANNPNPFIPGTAPAYLDNVRTKGARDLDLSIYKTVKIRESKVLRFDLSSYNITNTPQFGYPSIPSTVGSVQQGLPFGLITNTVNTPRQFQGGARFTF